MRIAYLAKHDSGGGDDEGSIAFALTQLEHDLQLIPEQHGNAAKWVNESGVDFVLCHHYPHHDLLRKIKCLKVCWCFDLVTFPDPTLERRNAQREEWATRMANVCDLMFMTDGDWVERWNREAKTTGRPEDAKLHWLPQGADERITGQGGILRHPSTMSIAALEEGAIEERVSQDIDILFTGCERGGQGRQSFVNEMRQRWGDRFHHVPKGVYREQLKELIARSKIVVAPDAPVTDLYWSNRVYTTLGFGGFLLHPWCENLCHQYSGDKCIKYYHDREQLHDLLEIHLKPTKQRHREEVALNGLECTLHHHLYRHRCEELIRTVQERLKT